MIKPARVNGYCWGCSRRGGSPSVANAQTATLSVLIAYDLLKRTS
jgi:hypothetical protein